MLTKESIEQFYADVDSLGLRFPGAAISDVLKVSKGTVSEYLNRKKEPSERFVKAFYQMFSESLKQKARNLETKQLENGNYRDKLRAIKNTADRKHAIPYYDTEATGGLIETEMTPIHAPAGTIDIGDLLRDSEAAIRIYGNSMLPNYPPGCVIGLVKCSKDFIEPGEVFVIETKDRRLLKRVFYKDDAPDSNKIYCYSDNIMKFEGGARHGKLAYPPFEIPKKEIVAMYIVTGVIKRNANSIVINR